MAKRWTKLEARRGATCVNSTRLFEVAAPHVVPQNPIGAKDLLDREGKDREGEEGKKMKKQKHQKNATRREKNAQNASLSTKNKKWA